MQLTQALTQQRPSTPDAAEPEEEPSTGTIRPSQISNKMASKIFAGLNTNVNVLYLICF